MELKLKFLLSPQILMHENWRMNVSCLVAAILLLTEIFKFLNLEKDITFEV